MADTDRTSGGVGRTIAGLALILAAALVYLLIVPGHGTWVVLLGGLAALGVLVVGVLLAGRWMGVSQRRRVHARRALRSAHRRGRRYSLRAAAEARTSTSFTAIHLEGTMQVASHSGR